MNYPKRIKRSEHFLFALIFGSMTSNVVLQYPHKVSKQFVMEFDPEERSTPLPLGSIIILIGKLRLRWNITIHKESKKVVELDF